MSRFYSRNMQDDDSRDRIGDALILDLWGSDDGITLTATSLLLPLLSRLARTTPCLTELHISRCITGKTCESKAILTPQMSTTICFRFSK